MSQEKIVVLTGAGISAESGIKTFRDAGGLWEGYNVMEVASPEGWKANSKLVLDFYNQRIKGIRKAKPNLAHKKLVDLEKYYDVTIITQNIDDLHERAGSSKVIHLHGEIFKMRSSVDESLIYDVRDEIKLGALCERGSQLRPHVVWFGEAVPMMEEAINITHTADIFIVVGTSLAVYPAAGLIHYVAPEKRKYLIDPHIPDVKVIPNFIIYRENATVGVEKLVRELLS